MNTKKDIFYCLILLKNYHSQRLCTVLFHKAGLFSIPLAIHEDRDYLLCRVA
jgi:hypothetical protein